MEWRNEFPGLAEQTYLNSCSYGLLSRRVRGAIDKHLDRWQDAPDWNVWGEAVEDARGAFARFIGARPEEIAIQANASSGVSAVMSALPSGRIATVDIDFPTAGAIAERQKARGLKHDHLRLGLTPTADEWAPKIKGAALACLPAVASFHGYKLDIKEFAARAHEHEVPVLMDAFQACGTYPIDVKKLDVDFLVTGVYKWLMAPVGLAFLYVRPDHHALVPTTGGWYGNDTPYDFDPLGAMAKDARRFEYGGPNVLGCVALAASLQQFDDIGLANVEAHNGVLVDRVIHHARERKLEVLTPEERASIVTFRVPHLDRALAACAREKVIINTRLGGIRVSPHFYNRAEEIDRLFDVLDAVA